MLRLAANISLMFAELPFLERPAAARDAGFEAIECQFPYDVPLEPLTHALEASGLPLVLLNAPAGPDALGGAGLAALPGQREAFRAGVTQALDYARALGCPRIHCLAGFPGEESPPGEAERVYLDNLAYAAEQAAPHGVTVMIEPINTRDDPGYFMSTCAHARAVIERLAPARLALQFDVYHVSIMEPDARQALADYLDVIGHIQVSGLPGRHEPDASQEIDYPAVFAEIERLGYDGWVGCEYRPRGATRAGLAWAAPYGITA